MSWVNIKGTIRLEYGHLSELKYSAIPPYSFVHPIKEALKYL